MKDCNSDDNVYLYPSSTYSSKKKKTEKRECCLNHENKLTIKKRKRKEKKHTHTKIISDKVVECVKSEG